MLPVKSSCRDLGIIINKDLSFTEHVNSIVYKAHQRANAIHRCFESRNVNLSLRAYMVYVRPLLEHNTVIWSPHLKDNLEAIERVQRRFTKRLPGFNNFTYSERLHRLGIPTLELRRLCSDLIIMVLQNYLWLHQCYHNRISNEEIHKHYPGSPV